MNCGLNWFYNATSRQICSFIFLSRTCAVSRYNKPSSMPQFAKVTDRDSPHNSSARSLLICRLVVSGRVYLTTRIEIATCAKRFRSDYAIIRAENTNHGVSTDSSSYYSSLVRNINWNFAPAHYPPWPGVHFKIITRTMLTHMTVLKLNYNVLY